MRDRSVRSASVPKVSFVVPCYNYGRYLADCLESIFNQRSDVDFEIIAIDDCSTDNTLEILDRYKDSRLRIIRHAVNEGHVKTISQGILESRGELVARIDPDDRYRPGYLATVVPKFTEHEEVGFVYGDVAMINSQGEIVSNDCDTIHPEGDAMGNEFVELLHRNYVCAATVIARRNLWLGALPVPEHLAFTDWYYNLMIARRCKFHYVRQVLADYRVHAANLHARTILDGSEEVAVRYILERMFTEREQEEDLERAKQSARHSIYAAQLRTLADKYFGAAMNGDARRCYLQVLRHRPDRILSSTLLRRLAATFLNREVYNRTKRGLGIAQ
jgi:glycosyltransferase involved in cell wall biosynthesis